MDTQAEVTPRFDKGSEVKWRRFDVDGLELVEAESLGAPEWWKQIKADVAQQVGHESSSDQRFGVRVERGGGFVPSVIEYEGKEPLATWAISPEQPTLGQAQVLAQLGQEAFLDSKSRSDWDGRRFDVGTGRFVLPSQQGK